MSSQIAIVGYHRSGTSAMAQNCEASGLFLGDDLLGAKPTNPMGHYEDRAFFEINEAILKLNYNRWDTAADLAPLIPPAFYRLATELVARRDSEHEVWGFKDPRTCLLLDFWDAVLPDPKYLVCLRHYSACIDSVNRRRLHDFYALEKIETARNVSRDAANFDAICANWCVYMAGVLQFLTLRPHQAVVLRVDRLERKTSVSDVLNRAFGLDLEPIALGETFRPELFRAGEMADLPLHPDLKKTADDLWDALCDLVTPDSGADQEKRGKTMTEKTAARRTKNRLVTIPVFASNDPVGRVATAAVSGQRNLQLVQRSGNEADQPQLVENAALPSHEAIERALSMDELLEIVKIKMYNETIPDQTVYDMLFEDRLERQWRQDRVDRAPLAVRVPWKIARRIGMAVKARSLDPLLRRRRSGK